MLLLKHRILCYFYDPCGWPGLPQQFLYFFPLLQGQGSFLPILWMPFLFEGSDALPRDIGLITGIEDSEDFLSREDPLNQAHDPGVGIPRVVLLPPHHLGSKIMPQAIHSPVLARARTKLNIWSNELSPETLHPVIVEGKHNRDLFCFGNGN
ncbi:MAG: hypothetical protein RBG13Loki_2434 [Promethearchaeota archaeon CR_4]|nr:MAG: hypothetical protein RBG13Loki_2434 [Candidatus Lokiarchaeota archaeon CR_4]